MLPSLSIAMLPIQRLVESGEKVPCWKTVGVPALGLRSSYQRTPSTWLRLLPLTFTEWSTSSDSWPSANLRYARRYIRRSASESSLLFVPGCVMQVPPEHACVNEATGMLVGPV